jgi:hypothetical protein
MPMPAYGNIIDDGTAQAQVDLIAKDRRALDV